MLQEDGGTRRLITSGEELRAQVHPDFGSAVVLAVSCLLGYTVWDLPEPDPDPGGAAPAVALPESVSELCLAVARSPQTAVRGHFLDLMTRGDWGEVVARIFDRERPSIVRGVVASDLLLRPAAWDRSIFEPSTMRTDVGWVNARQGALDGVAGGDPHDGVVGGRYDGRIEVAVFSGRLDFGRSRVADSGARAWLESTYPAEAVAWLQRIACGEWGEFEAWRACHGDLTAVSYRRWLDEQGPL